MMLRNARVMPTIPAQDMARAKAFYSQKLGLTAAQELEGGAGVIYECGDGFGFLLFPSAGESSGTHTQMAFEVDDAPATVKELRGRGVTFEEYDLPGFKTVDSIAETGGVKGAWFKDSEGNLIAVGEPVPARVTR